MNFPAMDGAIELIQSLKQAGFGLAIGSSGPPENVAFVLERLQAQGLFDAAVTGRDVQFGKPHPQVFLTAAAKLGVPPARCAVIEDAPVGITAAQAAGMANIGLLSTGHTPESLAAAQLVVRSLRELTPARIAELIRQTR